MNRKQKIIVSTTGIFLVLLILVGLTYAYFLTRINGNTNDKSISVSTAKLELTYGDNSAEILGKDLVLEPSDTEIGTKTFTVTNNGNDTSYVVVIENVSITKTSDGSTTTFESNDFRYTLTCTKSDGTSCDGVNTQSVFPINGGVLVGNSIKEGDVHAYTFKMWYIDTGIDQSNDMGKTIQAKLNITNIASMTNPYSANKNSLAYNIIDNAKNKTNGTELLSSPKSRVAEDTSGHKFYIDKVEEATSESSISIATKYQNYYWTYGTGYTIDEDTGRFTLTGVSTCKYNDGTCNTTLVGKYLAQSYASDNSSSTDTKKTTTNLSNIYKVITAPTSSTSSITAKVKKLSSVFSISTEKNLSITNDDYGSSYYFRGGVEDNYVNFAGMCWRIVRVSGDGSIKLILEDQDNTCATSDGNWNIPITTGESIKTGYFGYTQFAAKTLTASDGTQNPGIRYLMNYLNGQTNNDKSMVTAFKNFQIGSLTSYLSYLKIGDWCLNNKVYSDSSNSKELTSVEILDEQIANEFFYYDPYLRLYEKKPKEPTLKCNGTNMNKFADNTDMYVGTLTADEIVYAGGKVGSNNPVYYLTNSYQKSNHLNFWTLAPNSFYSNLNEYLPDSVVSGSDRVYVLGSSGSLGEEKVNNDSSFRPAINLKSGVQISGGDGTKTNPYIVKTS